MRVKVTTRIKIPANSSNETIDMILHLIKNLEIAFTLFGTSLSTSWVLDSSIGTAFTIISWTTQALVIAADVGS